MDGYDDYTHHSRRCLHAGRMQSEIKQLEECFAEGYKQVMAG